MNQPLDNCKFCFKPVNVVQEDHESFIVVCEGTCGFYLGKPMTGPTYEVAVEKYNAWLKELELGADLWDSKIKGGVVED